MLLSPAHAEETPEAANKGSTSGPSLPLGGRVYADYYAPLKNTDVTPFHYAGTSLWIQGDPKLGEKSGARFILQGDALDTTVNGPVSHAQIREGFVTYSDKGWDLKAGKMIIPWGKTDAINPTDLISAKDYTVFNPDEEVRRTGQTSIQVGYTPSQGAAPWTLTGIFTPAFPQSVLLINPNAVPAGVTMAPTIVPPATYANTEQALKAAYTGTGWDASVMFFRGFNHLPEFVRSGPLSVAATFHRIHATGGDVSFTSGKYIFRGETAYVWTENNDGTNPTIIPTHWDSVFGVERPFGTDFRLQVQGLWRYIPRYTAPDQAGGADPLSIAFNRQLAATNALILNYQEKSHAGATARFGYTNESNGIDAEVFLVGYFIGGDYLVRPKFTYSWTDALKTTLGVDWYGGPLDRSLGQLQVYNSLFMEAKYSF
jgi:hypothetical protein